jgi:hypothetical protein
MRRLIVCLSLFVLASCATETEELASTPSPADPQPAALKDGLSVLYIGAKLNSIPELKEWLTHKDGQEGVPLETLTHYMEKGLVLTSGKEDLVGAYISGYLQFETPGEYRFQVTNNDGVSIHLGSALLYDDPKVGADRTSEPIPVEISAPGWYALEIWYFEKKGTATLDVLWSRPASSGFETIAAEVLKHE